MTDGARKLLHDVMVLPTQDPACVTVALIASLEPDDEDDEDSATAWATEIERRAERVIAGDSQASPWDEVRVRLLDRLRRD